MKVAHAETLEVNLIASGCELTRLEQDDVLEIRPGMCAVIPSSVEHSSWTRGASVTFHNLHLYVDRLRELEREVGIRRMEWRRGPIFRTHEIALLFDTMRREEAKADKIGHALIMETLAMQLALLLLRVQSAHPRVRAVKSHSSARLARVAELLRADPSSAHSISDLAREAEMSPFHFVRAFRKRYGRPPHAYLLDLRLERARELVLSTDLPLTTIAQDLGFGSSSRFSDAFKRRYGAPPSRARSGSRKSKI